MKKIALILAFLLCSPVSLYAEEINTYPDDPPATGVNHFARYSVEEEKGVYAIPPTKKFGMVKQENLAGETLLMFRGGILVRVTKECATSPEGLFIGKASGDLKNMVPFGLEIPPSIGKGIIVTRAEGVIDSSMVEICFQGQGDDFWFDANLPVVPLKK